MAGFEVITEDPADDLVLATAVIGRANVLCTLDRHFAFPAVPQYARSHGVEVTNDVELLRRLRSGNFGIQ
jgi:predicted nucleic acid-binding protein